MNPLYALAYITKHVTQLDTLKTQYIGVSTTIASTYR